MKARIPRFGIMVLGAALSVAPMPAARADDSAAAQALFDQAKKAMAVHDYAQACPKFQESLKLQEGVGTILNLADCYEHEGKLASAWSKFLEVATKARAAGQTQRARIGRDRAAALAPKLSNLVIDVPPAPPQGLEIRRDGTVVGEAEWGAVIPADAGAHTIDASAPGRTPWSQTVAVPEGATTAHASVPDLPLLPPPPTAKVEAPAARPLQPAPAPDQGATGANVQRTMGILTTSLGVAGIGIGTAFGLLSISKHETVTGQCSSTTCPDAAGVAASKDAITFGDISTIAFVAGGVGLAAGLTLWLTAPRSPETGAPVAQLVVGPGEMAVVGTW
jgi:hypothetical protein